MGAWVDRLVLLIETPLIFMRSARKKNPRISQVSHNNKKFQPSFQETVIIKKSKHPIRSTLFSEKIAYNFYYKNSLK